MPIRLWILVLALVIAAPLRAGDPLMPLRMAVNEARLHVGAGSFDAATRVLKSVRQQMALEPGLDKYRTQVEFVLWDLRMGNRDAAAKDLDALAKLLGVP